MQVSEEEINRPSKLFTVIINISYYTCLSQVDGVGYKWGFSTALKYAFTCSAKILFT